MLFILAGLPFQRVLAEVSPHTHPQTHTHTQFTVLLIRCMSPTVSYRLIQTYRDPSSLSSVLTKLRVCEKGIEFRILAGLQLQAPRFLVYLMCRWGKSNSFMYFCNNHAQLMSSQPLKLCHLETDSLPFTDYISRTFVLTSVFSFFDEKNYRFFCIVPVASPGRQTYSKLYFSCYVNAILVEFYGFTKFHLSSNSFFLNSRTLVCFQCREIFVTVYELLWLTILNRIIIF